MKTRPTTPQTNTNSRLGLGTAQFGLDYAISADQRRPDLSEVRRILSVAAAGGIKMLDTANKYGTAESIIGKCAEASKEFKIVTKLPALQKAAVTREDVDTLTQSFGNSLRLLQRPKLYGLMTHWAPDLLCSGGGRLFDAMVDLKAQGLVDNIGSSVYSAAHVEGLLNRYSIDLIQLPFNILDQRLAAGGLITELAKKGVEIHVRSAFLKGLIFSPPELLPGHFHAALETLRNLREFASYCGLTLYELALGFLLEIPEFSRIVVGVTSARQLSEHLSIKPLTSDVLNQCRDFAISDPQILDPNNWPRFKV